MARTVCLIAGDGIGPEVTGAARRVLDASGVEFQWLELPAGAHAVDSHGVPLPRETLDALEEHRLALKGPLGTPIGKGFMSVNVQLRKLFQLYAAVRPVRSLPGVRTRYQGVDIVVIRENTEGLYSGLEHEVVPGVVESIKVATEAGCERIARFALEYARQQGRSKVTVFHKANILKLSDGLFIECARRIHEQIGAGIEYQELIIDNGSMQIVQDPTRFDLLLLENLYGDVLSDMCAGLVGGLGVVPGANIGADCAIFEAVHGSAPDIAGLNVANPLAVIMSGVMLLDHIGERQAAARLKSAYEAQLSAGKPELMTRDLGGTASTEQFTDELVRRLEAG